MIHLKANVSASKQARPIGVTFRDLCLVVLAAGTGEVLVARRDGDLAALPSGRPYVAFTLDAEGAYPLMPPLT